MKKIVFTTQSKYLSYAPSFSKTQNRFRLFFASLFFTCLLSIGSIASINAQCSGTMTVAPYGFGGGANITSNYVNANTSGSYCNVMGPHIGPITGSGEVTWTFPNKTGYIDIRYSALSNASGSKEYFEVWLDGTFINLSTYAGITFIDGNIGSGCNSVVGNSYVTTASALSYPNKAGVVATQNDNGGGVIKIDLSANGCAAQVLSWRE